jgi:hypothetical protein
LIRTIQSLRAGLRRYLMLVQNDGLVRASARGIRFLRRGDSDLPSPLVPARALDPADPATLASNSIHPSVAADLLEPAVVHNLVHGQGASTCFVVRVTSSDPPALERTIQSILRQTEPTWEILLSPARGVEVSLDDWLDIDWRIRRLPQPADDRNDLLHAAKYATAHFVGAIVQGDLVDDELVDAIAREARRYPDADVVYTDEARIRENERISDYFHKPDWSPEYLHSVNYLGRFTALRKALLLEAVAEPTSSIEASDYALLLEVTRRAASIVHIDDALYFASHETRRPVGGFFSDSALVEARRVLQTEARREDRLAVAVNGRLPGTLSVEWPIDSRTQVTLVILTGMRRRDVPGRGNIVLATHFVRSIIERSTFSGYRILLIDDGEVPADLRALLTQHGHETRSYQAAGAFSFAHKANFGIRLVEEGLVILLNDDMEVMESDWIQAMAGLALRREIGTVGARLLYPDGALQHAGIALGYHGATGHILHRAPSDGSEYGGFASVVRNVSAVTGAAMAFRKSVFDELDGFDERFSVDYNDVDFCLRLGQTGYRVVVTPGASLYHFHNSSLQRTHEDKAERQAFISRWGPEIERDPYFSKHFQRRHNDLPLLPSDGGADG